MKPLLTATALTLSLGIVGATGAAAAGMGSGVPEERRTYESRIEGQIRMYEEWMETMDVDPAIRASWVKVNQSWNSVTDEPVKSDAWMEARGSFEGEWDSFVSEFEAAQDKGMASNSAVPEERRTFEQSTAYDIARYDAILIDRDPPKKVSDAFAEARANWYAMHNAETLDEWDAARDAYVESWYIFVDEMEKSDMSG